MNTSIRAAAEKRAAAAGTGVMAQRGASIPDGVPQRRTAPMACQMRAGSASRDGKEYLKLTGYASTYEQGYEMWDWAGPYTEVVSNAAGSASLATGPDVVFLLNHTGIPFARTTSNTLDLSEDDAGLLSVAWLNPKRQDAQDLVASVEDGSSTEMSFAFRITSGQWSPDYTEYRINAYNIDRGDTSVVTYGANPNTSIEARAARFELRAEIMRTLRSIDGPELEAVRGVLSERTGAALAVGGPAAEGLRLLRAKVEQGSIDPLARTVLTAALTRAADGTLAQALAGDGDLAALLGVHPIPAPAVSSEVGLSLEVAAAMVAASA